MKGKLGFCLILSSILACVLASAFLVFGSRGGTVSQSSGGLPGSKPSSEGLPAYADPAYSDPRGVLSPLFVIPAGLAAFPLFFRKKRLAVASRSLSTGLLFSLNLFLFVPFFIPAAGLMAAAAIVALERDGDDRSKSPEG